MTRNELLQRLGDLDRITLEEYMAHAWVRPADARHFEEIDLARARLVHQLRHDMKIGDDAMDVVLHLLDQLYGMHERMRCLKRAIALQPHSVQAELWAFLSEEIADGYTDS